MPSPSRSNCIRFRIDGTVTPLAAAVRVKQYPDLSLLRYIPVSITGTGCAPWVLSPQLVDILRHGYNEDQVVILACDSEEALADSLRRVQT